MSRYVSSRLRRLVAERANRLCEYCLLAEDDTFFGCQVEHIISMKHGGTTEADNLAYACSFCNLFKGSDIASINQPSGELVRFFNPRRDRWPEHFRLNGSLIEPLTDVGEATARIFGFNNNDRVLERATLIAIERYPTAEALTRINS